MALTLEVVRTCPISNVVAVLQLKNGDIALFCSGFHGPFKLDSCCTEVKPWSLMSFVWGGQNASAAALDSDTGCIYAATDTAIYRIQPTDLAVTLVAGNPGSAGIVDGRATSARFRLIRGLCMHGPQLLVSDFGNNKLRQVNLANSSVSTVTVSGISQPGSLVHDKTTDSVLVADHASHQLWQLKDGERYAATKYAGSDGVQMFFGGQMPQPNFSNPSSIAQDDAGAFLIVDQGNACIKHLDAEARIVQDVKLVTSTGGAVQLRTPHGICITEEGRIIVSDPGGNSIHICKRKAFAMSSAGTSQLFQNKPAALGQCLWKSQQKGEMCDVMFKVEDEEVPAHRAVLASRSEYFERLLSEQWSDGQKAAIDIPETTATAFKSVLQYLYTDEVATDVQVCMDVVLLARRCMLFYLMEMCIGSLKWKLSADNAVRLCVWSHLEQVEEVNAMAKQAVATARKQLKKEDEDLLKQHPDLLYEIFKCT